MAASGESPTSLRASRSPSAARSALQLIDAVIQAKLTVGPAGDRFEREADDVAAVVVRAIRSETIAGSGARTDTDQHVSGSGSRAQRAVGRAASPSSMVAAPPVAAPLVARRIQRAAPIQAAGGDVDADTERIMRSTNGRGSPLHDGARLPMERAFGADFSSVRVHEGAQATDLNNRIQAKAFTTGSDIYFRDGVPDTSTVSGQSLLAHELTHTIQQGAAVSRMIDVSPGSASVVQRHASWEHKMLGDVDPATLEIIAAGRDVAAEQAKRTGFWASTRASAKTITTGSGQAIDLDTVLHTIDQEIARLKLFQSSPPMGTVEEATAAMEQLDADRRKAEIDPTLDDLAKAQATTAIDDAKWGVKLLSIRLLDGTNFLVTYGEMNTLADFYGSAQDMARVPADNFRSIVGGVREESIRKFMHLRNDLTVGDKQYEPDSTDHNVEGAIGNKGTLNGAGAFAGVLNADQFGELKMMGESVAGVRIGSEPERLGIEGRDDTSYTAGLGRNACHFAPHSWHSWATAHAKAITLAQTSWTNRDRAAKLEAQTVEIEQSPPRQGNDKAVAYNRKQRATMDIVASDSLNAAMIENGFGDHFLQDSYAAGHLINKTLIMQWFAKWLDTKGAKRDYMTEDEWRRVQQIAYGQPGVAATGLADPATIGQAVSNDPQSVENLDGDWTTRFKALGLKVPGVLRTPGSPEWDLFTWWQERAMNGEFLTVDYKDLMKVCPIRVKGQLQATLKNLIDDGVVYYSNYSTKDRAKGAEAIGLETLGYAKDLRIKKEYIPDPAKAGAFTDAVAQARGGDSAAYDKMAQAVTYGDYHAFLNHGYLQLASNVLHDHFCANGLDVATAEGDTPYKIYGDNAMLGKESSKMVKYSSETAHQSRDSIIEIATTGRTNKSTASIGARFPAWVRPKGASANLSLEAWHGDGGSLHKFCFDTIFPDVAAVFSKSTAVAKSKLVPQISKDATKAVHSGEAF